MSGSARSSAGSLVLDAESWQDELLSEGEIESLDHADREIIFSGLVEYAQRQDSKDLEVERRAREATLSADAPLLIPGTRVHVRAGGAVRDALKGMVRTAVLFAASGGDPTVFVGLSVDLVVTVFEKVSKLDEDETNVVRGLLELRRSGDGRLPTMGDLGKAMPDERELEGLVDKLVERGIVVHEEDRLRVSF